MIHDVYSKIILFLKIRQKSVRKMNTLYKNSYFFKYKMKKSYFNYSSNFDEGSFTKKNITVF